MNTNEVLNGLNEAITAYHRLPSIEAELKSVTEDRDFTKLQLDEANETIAKLKLQIETQATENAADKITIGNLQNQITELDYRNADLDHTAHELINQVRTLRTDIEAANVRLEIANADNASLETKLADAKSFGARLKAKLADIGSLISQAPEATNTAPFPVSESVELPIPTVDPVSVVTADDNSSALDQSSGKDMVSADDNKVAAAGCYPYRYW